MLVDFKEVKLNHLKGLQNEKVFPTPEILIYSVC